MRRLLALTMILSLLSVTAMPVLAAAPVCKYAMQQAAECGSCDAPAPQPALAGAAQLDGHDRIECGCGCHRDIDGLPHLLEPHTLMQTGLGVAMASLHAAWPAAQPRFLQLSRLQRPPPRTLS